MRAAHAGRSARSWCIAVPVARPLRAVSWSLSISFSVNTPSAKLGIARSAGNCPVCDGLRGWAYGRILSCDSILVLSPLSVNWSSIRTVSERLGVEVFEALHAPTVSALPNRLQRTGLVGPVKCPSKPWLGSKTRARAAWTPPMRAGRGVKIGRGCDPANYRSPAMSKMCAAINSKGVCAASPLSCDTPNTGHCRWSHGRRPPWAEAWADPL